MVAADREARRVRPKNRVLSHNFFRYPRFGHAELELALLITPRSNGQRFRVFKKADREPNLRVGNWLLVFVGDYTCELSCGQGVCRWVGSYLWRRDFNLGERRRFDGLRSQIH